MTRINHFFIYMVIIGWFGTILSFLLPIIKYSMSDDMYDNPYYDPLWLGGIALTLGSAGIISLGKRNKYRKAALLFSLVGLVSGVLFLIYFLK